MYVLITLFGTSLFLIAVFFTIKEREIYRGRETWLTRFLRNRSPRAEVFVLRLEHYGIRHLRTAWAWIGRLYDSIVHSVITGSRALVVVVAERMIHAVKGEKSLSQNGTSSMYLKHLKEHKDNTAGGTPQV